MSNLQGFGCVVFLFSGLLEICPADRAHNW